MGNITIRRSERLTRYSVLPGKRILGNWELAKKSVAENRGGLKGSTQHWLAVYPPEFEIPTFFAAFD